VTTADLVRSALLCGHLPPGNFWPFHGYRGHSAIWRASITRAHLSEDPATNRLVPTNDYRLLDATERGFVSWLLGSSVTHLVAQRRLGLPVLLHLTAYGAAFGVTFDGRLRPDFIAPLPGGGWAVFEAKGRARLRSAAMTHAKNQTNAITSIGGVTPALRAACISVFRVGGLEIELQDPPPEPIALEAKAAGIVAEYYKTVTDLLEAGTEGDLLPVGDQSYRTAKVDALDLMVGLSAEIEAALSSENEEERLTVLQRGLAQTVAVPRGASIGPDGVLVVLGDSWYAAK
jgi:hypothetical protein